MRRSLAMVTGVSARSGSLEQQADRGGKALPGRQLAVQLLPAVARQTVHLRRASLVGRFPLRDDPALAFEPVQGGIERPLADRQLVIRERLYALDDRPAVERSASERLENEEIERALEEIGGFRHDLTRIPRPSTMRYLDHRQ